VTGKCYYLATLGAWRRHAHRFANSHFVVLDPKADLAVGQLGAGNSAAGDIGDATPVLILVEADEGGHFVLENDPACEALPHPLAQKSISPAVQSALAAQGVARNATTFDVAEALARVHPLLRHRVF